jgi:hypothetical protein
MGFFDKLASGVNGLFQTQITDGVRGTARVISASGYDNDPTYGGGVYQNCHMEVVVEAPGIPATAATIKGLVHQQKWPQPGMMLPALIERTNPQVVQILWDETVDAATLARAEAERVAAEQRGETPAGVSAAGATVVGSTTGLPAGATVNIVGDVSQLTPEQKEKLKAMGVDIDALLGGQG